MPMNFIPEVSDDLSGSATQVIPEKRRIYVDRTRHKDRQRCKRLRWLGYHAGATSNGIQPKRKSIHLVIGSAVHVGMERLLWGMQDYINQHNLTVDEGFAAISGINTQKVCEFIEDQAVEAALRDLVAMTEFGVELDDQEKFAAEKAKTALTTGSLNSATAAAGGDSMIEITFEDMPLPTPLPVPEQAIKFAQTVQASLDMLSGANALSTVDWGAPIYPASKNLVEIMEGNDPAMILSDPALAAIEINVPSEQANAMKTAGLDNYLLEELAAQIEALVRAYARRRWKPLLDQFEILEVEREGEWQLGKIEYDRWVIEPAITSAPGAVDPFYSQTLKRYVDQYEIWFMSRHDALLKERQTGYLYLQSYKTTGSWDRRKEADAQIDMQGLSEAVDVEKRFSEAWHIIQRSGGPITSIDNLADQMGDGQQLNRLVNLRTANWLATLPEPPRILGVRYEYMNKGARRQDKNDTEMPNRYVADTPLIRAYKTDGITADDRKWGWSYEVCDAYGKSKRLDYRTWKKAPVWRFMTIKQWIDLLDADKVQPESYDKEGNRLDALADQFMTPIHVYRNEDDMRDMLEQLQAEEEENARDVLAVYAVRSDPGKMRSELNKRFSQNRASCSYPGKCQNHEICYGSSEIRRDPEGSGLYQIRVANHPQENYQP